LPVTEFKRRAVFFDRDGVLNELISRDGSFYSPQTFNDFHIVSKAEDVVNRVRNMGFITIVISNQPDISRGKLKQSELDKMTTLLINKLNIDDIFYCTHDDSNDTGCRKPAPGLLLAAQKKYKINFNESYMIGDTWKDVEAAKNAGIATTILLDMEYNQDLKEVIRVKNLLDVIPIINNGT